jgi:hypothetical protein
MIYDWMIWVLLLVGFAAAPFARLESLSKRQGIAAMILLTVTVALWSDLAFLFQNRTLPPISEIGSSLALLAALAVCATAWLRSEQRWPAWLALTFVVATVAIYCLSNSLSVACQRTCVSIRPGMTIPEVETRIARAFERRSDYHVVGGQFICPTRPINGTGQLWFGLRPNYVGLSEADMTIRFENGAAIDARASTLGIPWPKFPGELIAAIVLSVVCLLWLHPKTPQPDVPNISTIATQLQVARLHASHERRIPPPASTKRMLVSGARRKIRRFAFFGSEDRIEEVSKEDRV